MVSPRADADHYRYCAQPHLAVMNKILAARSAAAQSVHWRVRELPPGVCRRDRQPGLTAADCHPHGVQRQPATGRPTDRDLAGNSVRRDWILIREGFETAGVLIVEKTSDV